MDVTFTIPDIDDLDNMNIGELRYELRRLILQSTTAPISSMKRKHLIGLIQLWRCIPAIQRHLPTINLEEYEETQIEDTTVLVPTLKKKTA
jgi:hypothetical protein